MTYGPFVMCMEGVDNGERLGDVKLSGLECRADFDEKLGLPTACKADPEAVWKAILHDKKRSDDTITVVYAPKAGSFQLQTMPLTDLKETVFAFLGKE